MAISSGGRAEIVRRRAPDSAGLQDPKQDVAASAFCPWDELEDEIDLPAEEEVQYEVEDEIVLPVEEKRDEHTEEKEEEERGENLDEDNPKDEESLPLDWNEYKNVIDGLNCDLAELEMITKTYMWVGGRRLENYELGILLWQTKAKYEEEMAGLRGEISSLNNIIEERDSVISSLNNVIEERDSVISSLNNVIEERDSVISSLNNVIEGKEFDISEAMTKQGSLSHKRRHNQVLQEVSEKKEEEEEEKEIKCEEDQEVTSKESREEEEDRRTDTPFPKTEIEESLPDTMSETDKIVLMNWIELCQKDHPPNKILGCSENPTKEEALATYNGNCQTWVNRYGNFDYCTVKGCEGASIILEKLAESYLHLTCSQKELATIEEIMNRGLEDTMSNAWLMMKDIDVEELMDQEDHDISEVNQETQTTMQSPVEDNCTWRRGDKKKETQTRFPGPELQDLRPDYPA
ncbi:uncharacterized protein [Palaemon carinicauda]|uniref:uncharacterized protein n=1 Tax=Palaemon carinicauda TaxID=392227 RepID=UPI0035B5BB9E